jgi:hypothetical protein
MFIYSSSAKQSTLENFGTSTSSNTEVDQYFLKPGASRAAGIVACRVQGKGNALTALSGISIRMKQWTASASTSVGATSTTPVPKNNLVPACVATAGMVSTSTSGVTPGTTGLYCGLASMGASGPGGWVSINPDDVALLDGGASKSLDLISSSPLGSAAWEFELDHAEA